MEFFENLAPLLKTFWIIASFASLVFLIQTILVFAGIDGGDSDLDLDSDGDGGFGVGEYLTFRNLINFLLGFSWTGVLMYDYFSNKTILVFIAVLVGVVFVLLFFYVMVQIKKLAEDNSFRLEETIGKTAEVYLPIPNEMSGKGKILVSVKGSMHELQAITAGGRIETGAMVIVLSIENGSILKVEKL